MIRTSKKDNKKVDPKNNNSDASSSTLCLANSAGCHHQGTHQTSQQFNLSTGSQQLQNNNQQQQTNNNGPIIPQPGLIPVTQQVPEQQVFAVSLNLPQFTADRPEIWFAIAEADFTANRITSDSQRYSQILKALQPNIQNQLWDIISNPPPQD
ncbi:hypothetical protein KQX54_013355, partial [Cotesia glomerata]